MEDVESILVQDNIALGSDVDFHHLCRRADGDETMVETEVRRQHHVAFIANRRDSLTCLDVIQGHDAGVGTAPSRHQQQLAVAAELHIKDVAFRKTEVT